MLEKVEAVVEELKALDMGAIEVVDCAACTRARKSVVDKEALRMDSQRRGAGGPDSSAGGGSDDGGRPAGRRACCSTCSMPILCLKRWEKLCEDLWDKKRRNWNISKVPEIHDAVKYDLIHHKRLASGFAGLYAVSKRLSDVIVPREYGPDQLSRARIGGMVCQRLVRKLLIDMTNCLVTPATEELPPSNLVTAEEFLARKVSQEDSRGEATEAPDTGHVPAMTGEAGEAEFAGLDASRSAAALKSPHRRVRTRLYFTSESHIQTLMNALRYCHLAHPCAEPGGPDASVRVVCPGAEERLARAPVFEYLSQVVLRLYEDKHCAPDSPERHRVEVLFSPGADGDPEGADQDHVLALAPLRPLHAPGHPLTLAQVRELLGPFSEELVAG